MFENFGIYFKKSFRSISDNPILFVPILLSFLVMLIPMALVFFGMYSMSFTFPKNMLGPNIIILILMVITIAVLQLLISAGKFNMIKQVVINGQTDMDDFKIGVKKYTGKLFLGHLIIFGSLILAGLIIIPIAMGLGSRAFLLIILIVPLVILGFFISFWQTILVYEDCKSTESIGKSFSFVKKHFWFILIVNIIKGIFTGNNNVNNRRPNNTINFGGFLNFNMPFSSFNLGAMGVFAIIVSIIKAISALFFDVLFFVIYDDRNNKHLEDNKFIHDEIISYE